MIYWRDTNTRAVHDETFSYISHDGLFGKSPHYALITIRNGRVSARDSITTYYFYIGRHATSLKNGEILRLYKARLQKF